MKKNSIQLEITRPCQENWQQMTDDDGGRFCQKCQHTVADLTGLTDSELLKLMKTNPPKCGRLRDDQLNRVIAEPRIIRRPSWKVAGLLTGLFTSISALSQAQNGAPTDSTTESPINEDDQVLIDVSAQKNPIERSKIQLNITLLNKKNKYPITDAFIFSPPDSTGRYTDSLGKCSFTVNQPNSDSIELLVHHNFYLHDIKMSVRDSNVLEDTFYLDTYDFHMTLGYIGVRQEPKPSKSPLKLKLKARKNEEDLD